MMILIQVKWPSFCCLGEISILRRCLIISVTIPFGIYVVMSRVSTVRSRVCCWCWTRLYCHFKISVKCARYYQDLGTMRTFLKVTTQRHRYCKRIEISSKFCTKLCNYSSKIKINTSLRKANIYLPVWHDFQIDIQKTHHNAMH